MAVRHGQGRVVVVADSDLFGDDSIGDYDHAALWGNLGHLGRARARPADTKESEARAAFDGLKDGRRGNAAPAGQGRLHRGRPQTGRPSWSPRSSATSYGSRPRFPHDAAYLTAVVADFRKWVEQGLGVPDFLDSLDAFHPDTQRVDGLEHLVVFPMYTQNGTTFRHIEAVWIRTDLARVAGRAGAHPLRQPDVRADRLRGLHLRLRHQLRGALPRDHRRPRDPGRFTWGGIFADREAARFRAVSGAAAATLKLALPPDAARLIESQELAQDTFVLWDLIHDRTHSHGDLPFDPFMIKQRMPYWLYALEELRCDLTAFGEAVKLEKEGVPHARYVQLAILFDRLFRFPITGARVRNYDGLGGQLLFSYLHRNGVVSWTDNRLSVDWDRLADGVADLRGEVEKLYRDGIDRSKLAHWLAAHQLVATYVSRIPPPSGLAAWTRCRSRTPRARRRATAPRPWWTRCWPTSSP